MKSCYLEKDYWKLRERKESQRLKQLLTQKRVIQGRQKVE